MDIKRSNKRKQLQSAVMYFVMAFSFCLFLWLKAGVQGADVRFDNEQVNLISRMWQIDCGDQRVFSELPGPFTPEKGKMVRYTITLDGMEGNAIMFRSIHQYVRIYLNGTLIKESGYQQVTSFGEAPYNCWVIARLPGDWQGKVLTIEEIPYYQKHSMPLKQVFMGYKNALVYLVINQCMPVIVFCSAIIMAAFALLLFSLVFVKKYVMYQVRWLSIFSMIMCSWIALESGGYQILYGSPPMASNLVFILFTLIPMAVVRFLLTYRVFYEDRWMGRLYWVSVVNLASVHILQVMRITDYIDSLFGTHVVLILIIVRIFHKFILQLLKKKRIEDIQVLLASMALALFACLDFAGFYLSSSDRSAAYFSKIGFLLFFLILSYYAIRDMVEERERGVRRSLLEEMAYTDMLTGLPNRNAFEREIYYRRQRDNTNCTVVVADLNGLKKINDTMGHQKGDEALIKAGEVLKNAFPERALLYRIGGDEFCLFVEGMTEEEMEKAADCLKQKTLSIAVGCCGDDGCGIDSAFRLADINMYEKKQEMKSKIDDINE